MVNRLRFIKAVYWFGIVLDLVSCLPLLLPDIAMKMYGLEDITITKEYMYVARMAATLMLGWTALLFWGVLQPVARKGILFLTLCPVMAGLVIASILVVTSGLVNPISMVPQWVANAIIIALFASGYVQASRLERGLPSSVQR